MFSAVLVLAETPQPSAVPHATPAGLPDWPPPQQPRPGAVAAGPGSQPAGPSSAGRLGSETGQLPGAAQLVPESPLLEQRFSLTLTRLLVSSLLRPASSGGSILIV